LKDFGKTCNQVLNPLHTESTWLPHSPQNSWRQVVNLGNCAKHSMTHAQLEFTKTQQVTTPIPTAERVRAWQASRHASTSAGPGGGWRAGPGGDWWCPSVVRATGGAGSRRRVPAGGLSGASFGSRPSQSEWGLGWAPPSFHGGGGGLAWGAFSSTWVSAAAAAAAAAPPEQLHSQREDRRRPRIATGACWLRGAGRRRVELALWLRGPHTSTQLPLPCRAQHAAAAQSPVVP